MPVDTQVAREATEADADSMDTSESRMGLSSMSRLLIGLSDWQLSGTVSGMGGKSGALAASVTAGMDGSGRGSRGSSALGLIPRAGLGMLASSCSRQSKHGVK